MRLFKKLFNAVRRIVVLTDFIVRLSLREKLFVGFFTLSLLFISIINVVFNPAMQKIIMTQMQDLQYAFTTWAELAVHMGVSSASIFVVLIISICFLPIVRHALQKEYLHILLCKPLGIFVYLCSMFSAFVMSLAVLILFWWLFVAATVAIHTGTFVFGSVVNFFALFVYSSLVLMLFMFFFSLTRDFLASIFTILFTLGAVLIMDQSLSSAFLTSSSVFIRLPYEWFRMLFSPLADWIAVAFEPDAALDMGLLWGKTFILLTLFGVTAAIRFRHTIEKVELS